MNYYGITPISNFIDNPQISLFHYDMFHGLAERDGREPPHDTRVYANTELPSPLMISRTGRSIPGICQPSSHLVVSEHYARPLSELHNVRLMPVVFKRLVDVEYLKGDMICTIPWGETEPRDLLRSLPDIPDFRMSMGSYFEVQSHRWRDAAVKFPTALKTSIRVGTPPLDEDSEICLSGDMLEAYPILCGRATILSEQAFNILKDGFDSDYFLIRPYSL